MKMFGMWVAAFLVLLPFKLFAETAAEWNERIEAALAQATNNPLSVSDYSYLSCPRMPNGFAQENTGYYPSNPNNLNSPAKQLFNIGNSCNCVFSYDPNLSQEYLETFAWKQQMCVPYGTDIQSQPDRGADAFCQARFQLQYPTRFHVRCNAGPLAMSLIAPSCSGGIGAVQTFFLPSGVAAPQLVTAPPPARIQEPIPVRVDEAIINEDKQAYMDFTCQCQVQLTNRRTTIPISFSRSVCHPAGQATSVLNRFAASYCSVACSYLPQRRADVVSVIGQTVRARPRIYYSGTGCYNGKQTLAIQVSGPGKVVSRPNGKIDCRDSSCSIEVCTVPSARNPDENVGALPYLDAIADQRNSSVSYTGHQYQRENTNGTTVTFRPAEIVRPAGAVFSQRPNVFVFKGPDRTKFELILRGKPEARLTLWTPGNMFTKFAGEMEGSLMVSEEHMRLRGNQIFVKVTRSYGAFSVVTPPSWAKCMLSQSDTFFDEWSCSMRVPTSVKQGIFVVSLVDSREMEVTLTGEGTGKVEGYVVAPNPQSPCVKSSAMDRVCNLPILSLSTPGLANPESEFIVTPDPDSEVESITAVESSGQQVAISTQGPDANGVWKFSTVLLRSALGKVKVIFRKKPVVIPTVEPTVTTTVEPTVNVFTIVKDELLAL